MYFWFLFKLQLVSHTEVSQAKTIFLRNPQDQFMSVLVVAMWLAWKDTFQRMEDRLDLWIIYWKRFERRSSSVWDTIAVTICMGQKGSGRWNGESGAFGLTERLHDSWKRLFLGCWSWQDPWFGVRLWSIRSSGTKFCVWESSNMQRGGWDLLLEHISVT